MALSTVGTSRAVLATPPGAATIGSGAPPAPAPFLPRPPLPPRPPRPPRPPLPRALAAGSPSSVDLLQRHCRARGHSCLGQRLVNQPWRHASLCTAFCSQRLPGRAAPALTAGAWLSCRLPPRAAAQAPPPLHPAGRKSSRPGQRARWTAGSSRSGVPGCPRQDRRFRQGCRWLHTPCLLHSAAAAGPPGPTTQQQPSPPLSPPSESPEPPSPQCAPCCSRDNAHC